MVSPSWESSKVRERGWINKTKHIFSQHSLLEFRILKRKTCSPWVYMTWLHPQIDGWLCDCCIKHLAKCFWASRLKHARLSTSCYEVLVRPRHGLFWRRLSWKNEGGGWAVFVTDHIWGNQSDSSVTTHREQRRTNIWIWKLRMPLCWCASLQPLEGRKSDQDHPFWLRNSVCLYFGNEQSGKEYFYIKVQEEDRKRLRLEETL